MKKELILIGGGGHCKSCIDIIENEGKWKISGIVDAKEKIGQKVLSYSIIACDKDIPELVKTFNNFLIAIGQIKSPDIRINIYTLLKSLNVNFPVIASPHSYVSKYSKIGEGTIIMHKAVVNANAEIGKNCIINTSAIIEHDAVIGNNCHIATSAVINGGCIIGDNSFIGSNATIKNDLKICENVVIAAGAVIIADINKPGIYAGIPGIKK